MSVGQVLLNMGLDKLKDKAKGAIVSAIPGANVAFAVTAILKKFSDAKCEDIRNEARQKLNCVHIELCPTSLGNTPITDMIEYVKERKGMAFMYSGIALWHEQPDFDVKPLSTRVWRWEGKHVTSGNGYNLHIQPCLICFQKSKKAH